MDPEVKQQIAGTRKRIGFVERAEFDSPAPTVQGASDHGDWTAIERDRMQFMTPLPGLGALREKAFKELPGAVIGKNI